MRRVLQWVQADATDPFADETSILPSSQMPIGATPALEQALTRFPPARSEIVVERLPCELSQLEADRPTRFPLPVRRPVDRVPVGRNIVHTEGGEVAAAQLAVDGEIEQRQVTCMPLQLQPGTDRPHVPRSQGRLRSGELALVPSLSTRPRDW